MISKTHFRDANWRAQYQKGFEQPVKKMCRAEGNRDFSSHITAGAHRIKSGFVLYFDVKAN